MRRAQTDGELISHLTEQVGFLRASALAYDRGVDAEAKRLAAALRTLCHDTARSKAVLAQLGLLTSLRFVDSVEMPIEPDRADRDGGRWVTMLYTPLALMVGGPRGFEARLDQVRPSTPKRFETWWTAVVLVDGEHNSFARKDLVLSVANRDGGSHVDPTLSAAYAALSREHSLGTVTYGPPDGEQIVVRANPALAVVRQIAWEVDATLTAIVGK